MISIIDYGMGNLYSVKNALNYVGLNSEITSDTRKIELSDAIILPGVGAFPDAMTMLTRHKLDELLIKQADIKPILGICLGFQMLFTKSYEGGQTAGLGLMDGTVDLIKPVNKPGIWRYKVPHIGWNELVITKQTPLTKGIHSGEAVYFVHSYMVSTTAENTAAYCEHGTKITAIAQKGNVYGAQFHPEKSGEIGLTMIKNFGEISK